MTLEEIQKVQSALSLAVEVLEEVAGVGYWVFDDLRAAQSIMEYDLLKEPTRASTSPVESNVSSEVLELV